MGKQSQEIPAELADQLEERIRQVLAHPGRRQILRTLNRATQRMSAVELGLTIGASCPLSSTVYHARRLEEVGLTVGVDAKAAKGSPTHYYSSLIGDNRLLLAVLQATEDADHEHLAPAAT